VPARFTTVPLMVNVEGGVLLPPQAASARENAAQNHDGEEFLEGNFHKGAPLLLLRDGRDGSRQEQHLCGDCKKRRHATQPQINTLGF
jgi:hypothetical protein